MFRRIEINKLEVFDLRKEWDAISPYRHQQQIDGTDISFNKILSPEILKTSEFLIPKKNKRVLDAGCGTGVLTSSLSDIYSSVHAVDISEKSINIAKKQYGFKKNIKFTSGDLNNYKPGVKYDLIVSNMTLMDVLEIDKFIQSLKRLLDKNGHIIATMIHPCNWPTYAGFSSQHWYSYYEEYGVKTNFKIFNEELPLKTTYIHRPLSKYLNLFSKNKLQIRGFFELGNRIEEKPGAEGRFLLVNLEHQGETNRTTTR